jgi:ribosomal protein L21
MGRQVSVKVGMGVQIDSSGTEQGRMVSFREIMLLPAGGLTQD